MLQVRFNRLTYLLTYLLWFCKWSIVVFQLKMWHTYQPTEHIQSVEHDAKCPVQCRSPDSRCVSSNHVPNMS